MLNYFTIYAIWALSKILCSYSSIASDSNPTVEEVERAILVKPFSWWASRIKKEKEIRVVTIGGSNTNG